MRTTQTTAHRRYRTLARLAPSREAERQVVRFSVRQRAEHLVLVVTFVALALTGIPQKFASADLSQWLITQLGGIDMARLLHRAFAVAFIVLALEHLILILYETALKRLRPSMAPSLADVRNAVQMIRYCLGLTRSHPRFDRFDYRQKFEYWGIVFGSMVMILTGLALWFPTLVTRLLPGQFVAAAREAHSNEALLALLVVVVWHLYSVMLSPASFPADLSIFTGRVSERRLLEEHPLEHQRLVAEGRLPAPRPRVRIVAHHRSLPYRVRERPVAGGRGSHARR